MHVLLVSPCAGLKNDVWYLSSSLHIKQFCNRPARFAVPAKIDTQMLYDGEGEDGMQDVSDDEEAFAQTIRRGQRRALLALALIAVAVEVATRFTHAAQG